MKSKHDVWAQQSRRRFLADTALGAAGLGLGAAGMESAQAQTKWGMMAYYVSGMVYFYGISNYVIHMPISWKLVVINCFLITVVEDFLLCVMAAFLAKRIRALAGDMFQN